jgi:hypothetical protein
MYYRYKNQLDALFILSLLNYTPPLVLGVLTAHHQEVECITVANGTCTSELTVNGPIDSQLRSITSTICHICTFYLLMKGCLPKTCRDV